MNFGTNHAPRPLSPLLRGVLFLMVAVAIPAKVHALYLDPATGSILLQMIAGGVAGAAMLVKLYWRRLRTFFGRAKDDEPTT